MPFFYTSGEEVKPGDRVLLHGEDGYIEFVADPTVDPDDWLVKEKGGGVMIAEPKHFGRLFVNDPANYEDLVFTSREETRPQ
ncbi:MAG TPA: hypothetical protein VH302_16970 [Bryobacteraceae bacterium]|nr:hypothetical protein [Bryobacteraceae bacterium]